MQIEPLLCLIQQEHLALVETSAITIGSTSVALGGTVTDIAGLGTLTPASTNTKDLGSNSLRWRNIYTADLQMSNEGSQNDVDGTWGSYTIQEGHEDLFLLNKRTGKKYKFLLQEVDVMAFIGDNSVGAWCNINGTSSFSKR